jgi:hypothetical protein
MVKKGDLNVGMVLLLPEGFELAPVFQNKKKERNQA